MAKSILQNDKECYLCRRMYNLRTTRGLEEHHILFGRGRRELSERYGLKVWLCHNHHNESPTFAPDDYRQQIGMDAQAKTALAPIQPVRTSLCITKGRDGSLLLAEMTPQVPGQVDMDGDETPMPAMARVGRAGY